MNIKRLFIKTIICAIIALSVSCVNQNTGIWISKLRCEYSINPLGVEAQKPRLSWKMESNERNQAQTAYEILTASSKEKLENEDGDVWNSGVVKSDKSIHVHYNGPKLTSDTKYYWKVRVWDKQGNASKWSEIASWETGLLDSADWKAKWIGYETESAPMFRKKFTLNKTVERATNYISGLGYFELSVNGNKITDNVLEPAQTDYEMRTFYVAYDITENLERGDNVIGVVLGDGFYNQTTVDSAYFGWGHVVYGKPRLISQTHIHFTDGTDTIIMSGTDWKAAASPTWYNNVYVGDFYDARLEKEGWDKTGYDDGGWKNAKLMESPGGKLVSQKIQPCKRMKTLKPTRLYNPDTGVYVYDLGQNFAGWVKLKVKAPKGTEITLRFSEEIYDNKNINPESCGGRATGVIQTDKYICKGSEDFEAWEPRFTYHGFRYVEMTGYPNIPDLETVEGIVVYSSLEDAGHFACSDTLVNKIQKAVYWTHVSNMHGIFEDCPHREKCGWLGDILPEVSIYNFDASLLLSKATRDVETTRNGNKPVKPTDKDTAVVDYTGVPWSIAPGRRLGNHAPDWASKFVQIPWYTYLYYNDLTLAQEHWDGLKHFMNHLEIIARDNIIYAGYGDMSQPKKIRKERLPRDQTSTALYYFNSKILASLAEVLGYKKDAVYYKELSVKIKNSFNNRYYDSEKKWYGSQTLSSMALEFGIVPKCDEAAVSGQIARNVIENNNGHFLTGQMGSRYLYEALGNYGHSDVALGILDKTTYPGIGYLMCEYGATTFWEAWEIDDYKKNPNVAHSHNHPFQTGVGDWFYKGIGGINVDADNPGFKNIILKPQIPDKLEWANVSYNSVYGKIKSEWKKEDNSFYWSISIPVNTTALVYLPTKETNAIFESNKPIDKIDKIEFIEMKGEATIYKIGSGEYRFRVQEY